MGLLICFLSLELVVLHVKQWRQRSESTVVRAATAAATATRKSVWFQSTTPAKARNAKRDTVPKPKRQLTPQSVYRAVDGQVLLHDVASPWVEPRSGAPRTRCCFKPSGSGFCVCGLGPRFSDFAWGFEGVDPKPLAMRLEALKFVFM